MSCRHGREVGERVSGRSARVAADDLTNACLASKGGQCDDIVAFFLSRPSHAGSGASGTASARGGGSLRPQLAAVGLVTLAAARPVPRRRAVIATIGEGDDEDAWDKDKWLAEQDPAKADCYKQMFRIQDEVNDRMKRFVVERRALERRFLQDCGAFARRAAPGRTYAITWAQARAHRTRR